MPPHTSPSSSDSPDPTSTQSFVIEKRDDLSLNDVLTLKRNGGSVMRTPHVGNQHLAHLLWHKVGGRSVLYDRTLGRKDTNFHPHGVLKDGTFHPLADDDTLMTHARVKQESAVLNGSGPRVGENVAAFHTRTLRELLPNVDAEHYSDYLASHREIMLRILDAVTRVRPDVWERRVNGDGKTELGAVRSTAQLARDGVLGVTSEHQGWLVPNIINVLTVATLEAHDYLASTVYHVSGPDMINYIDGMRTDLDELYGELRRQLADLNLPEQLTFQLIPMSELRLAVPAAKRPALDELVSLWEREKGVNASLSTKHAPQPASAAERARQIAEGQKTRGAIRSRLRDAVASCREIFFRTEDRKHLSHHDFHDADSISIHPFALEAPVREVRAAMKFFRNALEPARVAVR